MCLQTGIKCKKTEKHPFCPKRPLAFASPKSILLLTTEEYPDAVSTFTVFALQIAISGLQCYFPIHKD